MRSSANSRRPASAERQEETSAPRRVAVIGSYAPSLINFRGPLLGALVARGHRVMAGAPDMDGETADRIRALGAAPFTFRLENTGMSPLGMFRSYRELRGLLRAKRPDLILLYTIKPVVLGALAGRAEGVTRIVSLITGLGFAFTGEKVGLKRQLARAAARLLYRVALRRSDVILFQNRDDEADFREAGLLAAHATSAVVDGSGVDIDHFGPAPLPAAPSFLMIARLLGDKGVREFAAAAARLKAEHPEVPVTLVGYVDASPDALKPEELDRIVAAGISFPGKLEDVRPAIAAASVYVLPSYREGTPRSVLEAMAMGRPVITTDVPGCRETVVDGLNGFLVAARDAESLYAAMKKFVDEPELIGRMGAESRRIAERRYDARKVTSDIMRHAGL